MHVGSIGSKNVNIGDIMIAFYANQFELVLNFGLAW